MAHIVVIGGFASSRSHLERVTTNLSEYWNEEITGVSFRKGMEDGVKLEQLVRKAKVFTHSAGILALKNTAPSEIVAIAPPLPTRPHTLLARAGFSGATEVVG